MLAVLDLYQEITEYSREFILGIPVLELFYICFPILGILLAMEYCWRKSILPVEVTRKIIHLSTGVIIAFLPFYVDYRVLQFLAGGLLLIVLLSYRLHIFQAIHAVKRVTIGELLYPVGIGICAFLEPAPWIFAAAILHLAIADSIAALAGQKWGKRTRYMIITHGKSLVGSFAFYIASLVIFIGIIPFASEGSLPSLPLLLGLAPFVLVLLENLSLFGSDDVTIPVAVIVLLSGLPS